MAIPSSSSPADRVMVEVRVRSSSSSPAPVAFMMPRLVLRRYQDVHLRLGLGLQLRLDRRRQVALMMLS